MYFVNLINITLDTSFDGMYVYLVTAESHQKWRMYSRVLQSIIEAAYDNYVYSGSRIQLIENDGIW
jgi:hypothetical protein